MAAHALAALRTLPEAALGCIIGRGRALILAPHADDESLGCGGLIAEACSQGRPPVVVIATDGTGSHPGSAAYPPARLRAVREDEARVATSLLGLPAGRLHFLGLPDTRAPREGPAFEAASATLSALCLAHACTAIVAPWRHDPHCDHQAAHLLALAVSQALGVPLVSYPIWGWTLPPDAELGPAPQGLRLAVARHLPAKRAAIAAHRSQHGGLITDDPRGFVLPPTLLRLFDDPYETFLMAGPH